MSGEVKNECGYPKCLSLLFFFVSVIDLLVEGMRIAIIVFPRKR